MPGPTSDDHSDAPLSRRERQRLELREEAVRTARELLAAGGPENLTLSAVARAVGVTPPALYRHFEGGREGVVRAVYHLLVEEFSSTVEQAAARYESHGVSAQIHAGCRAVLDWSLANRPEFDLVMGAQFARISTSGGAIPVALAERLGGVFAALFDRLVREHGLIPPAETDITPALLPQIVVYGRSVCPDQPVGVAYLMFTCWRQVYGVVCMAANRHLDFAYHEYDAVFEDLMDRILRLLGLTRSPIFGAG
ncbi:hypothetical protein SRB5_12050 [Streptomyces sp. RB5]|uniref:HTH tetR-type domain-containing protein n=1 Tax=Streptomyces smaragdinus TaxID=2585196 RepID=A0A7K0CCC3_9ACTN|nr:TetR/AcrR family transcriptional regulator [Streptomyces smaragdinus]MQY11091.1 hypothetical protein [Streptomyces smaragdinus]